MQRSKILGLGFYVPERVVTNDDLAKLMDTSDEWIQQRTGIKERRHVDSGPGADDFEGIGASDLAVKAGKKAIEDAGIEPGDIDMIIFATLSPDHDFPGSGCLLQHKLGLDTITALDIRNQCSGFIYGLSIADQYIKTGARKYILLVGSEVHSTGLDYSNRGRDVTVIFGDGAGAAIISASEDENKGILSTHLHSDGKYHNKLWIEYPSCRYKPRLTQEQLDDGKIFPKMVGKFVFKHALSRFPEAIREALDANGYTVDDMDLLIPHQANLRINEFVARGMKIPPEKVFNNIQKYGNTTAASIPIALTEAREEGLVKDGSLICLAAFGAGFTWASALIRW